MSIERIQAGRACPRWSYTTKPYTCRARLPKAPGSERHRPDPGDTRRHRPPAGGGEDRQEPAVVGDHLAHRHGNISEMNKVWQSWVVPGATPARATVLSPQLAAAEFKIEIAVVAAQP